MSRKSQVWSYKFCEICLKNSHEEIEMVRETIITTGQVEGKATEMWCCPVCGSTKRL